MLEVGIKAPVSAVLTVPCLSATSGECILHCCPNATIMLIIDVASDPNVHVCRI